MNRRWAELTLRVASLWMTVEAVAMLVGAVVLGVVYLGDFILGDHSYILLLKWISFAVPAAVWYAIAQLFRHRAQWFVTVDVPESMDGQERKLAEPLAALLAVYGASLLSGSLYDFLSQFYLIARNEYSVAEWYAHAGVKPRLARMAFSAASAVLFLTLGNQVVAAILWAKTPRTDVADGDSISSDE